MWRVRESSFIKQDGGGLSVLPTPGLGARVKGPRLPFRPRPRERSSGPYPGCSPRTLRTCRCPGVWPGGWSASWWYCRSQRIPCRRRGAGRRVSLRAPWAGLTGQLCSSPPSFPTPVPLLRLSGPRAPVPGPALAAGRRPCLSSSSMSSPSLVQPTSGAGSPMISAVSFTVVPLRALVLSGPF